ncbi:hypothetical protein PG993_008328 [Apiospora rasikravindrae]|uniref:AAA+ ATPase domain-containing protein n=1 Tax=Apiospora rasikravindrae TaxID=990691 RepID=A0ABR1T014_9PEZI
MARQEQDDYALSLRKVLDEESNEDEDSDEHRGSDERGESDEENCQSTTLAIKRPREPSKSPPLKRFRETPNAQAGEGSIAHEVFNENQQTGYRFHVLNRVFCSEKSAKCHSRIYQDEPHQRALRGVHHLAGNCLVADLDEFLRSRAKTAFVVFRDFFCATESRTSLIEYRGQSQARYFRQLVSIVSADLYNTIQRISKFAPDKDAYQNGRDNYQSPSDSPALSLAPSEYSPRFLFHHREELAAEAAKAEGGCALDILASYVLGEANDMYARYDEIFSRGMVSAESLPWLFHPNDIIVSREGPLILAYVLRQFPREGSQLELSVWNWGYNGHFLSRKDGKLTLNRPEYGEMRIDDLDVYPLRYATEETRQMLLENGNMFCALSSEPRLVSYQGPNYPGDHSYPTESRFMLDYQVYSKFHAHSEAFQSTEQRKAPYDRWPDSLQISAKLPDAYTILLPPGIYGFFLKEKKWVHLLVALVKPINWNKGSFDRLVLPRRTKNLIKGLVIVHKRKMDKSLMQNQNNAKQDDIIAGKGSGLIMLLHGGPGTGKTLTAVVENYLNTVLHLGRKWNCVLLLDEADVFLEERSLSDLDRNSLVSVFLRTLEYYEGMLILTSNRVGTFDEAFKSRIQLALHYRPLDGPGRRKIWHNFLHMMRENMKIEDDDEDGSDGNGEQANSVDLDDIVAHMDELAAYEMNGRQIRNSLATARQLAVFERETLDWDRIKDAIEVTSDFNNYIKEVHGHTDEQWVRDNRFR